MQTTLTLGLAAVLLAGCAGLPSAEKQAQMAAESRAIAAEMGKTLGGELKAAMEAGGPQNAIGVCKERAPAIAKAAAERTGMSIKRVSTKNRNPKAVPDAWEAAAIASFEKRLAAGEKAETLETYTVEQQGDARTFRYAKALVTQSMCLNCHGAPETLSEPVKARLASDYPDDKAVGYAAGMVRGIFTLRRPL